MASIAKALLLAGAEVHMLSLNTRKHFKKHQDIQGALPPGLHFSAVEVNTNITPANTFLNLLSGSAFHLSRFYKEQAAKKLREILAKQDFDWIQLDGLPMVVYLDLLRKCSKAHISLRAHNVEHRIWEQQLKNEHHLLRKQYLKLQVSRLKKEELAALKQLDALIPITAVDQNLFTKFGYSGPSIVIPCGIDAAQYTPSTPATEAACDVAYLASMDWTPNVTGVNWFIEEVYPLLIAAKPDIKVCLAGYEMPDYLLKKGNNNLHIQGAVDDKTQFLQSARVCMVPLLAGSGMRIKVLEYLALGKCVVSTAIGAEGIEVQPGEHILIGDTAKDFAQHILWALDQPKAAMDMGAKAQHFIRETFTNAALGEKLYQFYQLR
jgi:glycosyltransferase involved in cell wall biosynthesis